MARPHRRGAGVPAVLLVLALVLAGCSSGGSDTAPPPRPPNPSVAFPPGGSLPPVTYAELDQRLADHVRAAGLTGAALVIQPDTGARHTFTTGSIGLDTTVALDETSTWLTAAVLLTFVDRGQLSLDAPIGRWLPWMTGDHGAITLRQLLANTSGLPPSVDCGAAVGARPADRAAATGCDEAIAAAPLLDPPGRAFHVSPVGFHVAARLAEAVADRPWDQVAHDRVLDPLGMRTTFAPASEEGGLLAAGGTTTANDLGRFLAMVLGDGTAPDGTRVLSADAVRTMEQDQTVGLDTHGEPWVSATGVPTYGLGVWRDRLQGPGPAAVVSAPTRHGLYPFVDNPQRAWGVVVIQDRQEALGDAVGFSSALVQLAANALRDR